MDNLNELLEQGDIGVCVKDPSGKVLAQNSVCEKVCSNRRGKTCEKGCMSYFKRSSKVQRGGMEFFPSKILDDQDHYDLALVNDGNILLTLFYQKKKPVNRVMQELRVKGLTSRELEISELLLKDFTRREVASSLHISLPTVKTHLNNIYKKVGRKNLFRD